MPSTVAPTGRGGRTLARRAQGDGNATPGVRRASLDLRALGVDDEPELPLLVLHPRGRFVAFWNGVILLLLLQVMVVTPFTIGFSVELAALSLAVDIVFLVDVVVNFFVAFYRDERLVVDKREIARAYTLRGFFLIDLLTAIPFDLIFNSGSVWGVVAIFKLLKISRLSRLWRNKKRVTRSMGAGVVMYIMRLLIIFLLFAHWSACAFYFIAAEAKPSGEGVETWLERAEIEIESETTFTLYTTALYWSLTTLTTVGFGDLVPANDREKVFVTVMYLLGAVLYASIFGIVTTAVQAWDANRNRYKAKLESVAEFSRLHRLTPEMELRLKEYTHYMWGITKGFDIQNVIGDLPEGVRREVQMHLHSDAVRKVPLFAKCSDSFVRQLVMHLRLEVCLEGDFVVHKGDVATKMFFIRKGSLQVIGDDMQILSVMLAGSFFGEIGLFSNVRRTASVRAAANAELFSLTKDVLNDVLAEYPQYKEQITQAARRRMRRSSAQTNKPVAPLLLEPEAQAKGGGGGGPGQGLGHRRASAPLVGTPDELEASPAAPQPRMRAAASLSPSHAASASPAVSTGTVDSVSSSPAAGAAGAVAAAVPAAGGGTAAASAVNERLRELESTVGAVQRELQGYKAEVAVQLEEQRREVMEKLEALMAAVQQQQDRQASFGSAVGAALLHQESVDE